MRAIASAARRSIRSPRNEIAPARAGVRPRIERTVVV
jgi:hypothetical protein